MQLPLPSVDTRPICPVCGQSASLLGQWSPLWPWMVCRACSEAEPYHLDVLRPGGRTRTSAALGFEINPDAPSALREWRIVREAQLRAAVQGCKLARGRGWSVSDLACEWGGHYDPACKRCVRRANTPTGAARYRMVLTPPGSGIQLSLPVCERCGTALTAFGMADYQAYCPRCKAEMAVETFWRHRGIFGNDDVETILDRIQKSHAWVFEMGVLPDYWFQLMQQEEA